MFVKTTGLELSTVILLKETTIYFGRKSVTVFELIRS